MVVRLPPPQWTAIGLAAVGVALLTASYGRPPWIALALAITFALYTIASLRPAPAAAHH